MKRYVILTSVLALAACGGGGGGHHATVAPTAPAELAGRVSATESNSKITNMKSEVIVASNTNSVLSRASSYTDANGVIFKSYRLEDVKLFAADSKHTDNGYLQIGMNEDTGRIDNIQMTIGGVGAPVARNGETNSFYGPIFEYVTDSGEQAIFRMPDTGQTAAELAAKKDELVAAGKDQDGTGHWHLINEHMDVVTMGGAVGLQYSDFGRFNPVYKTKYKNAETLDNDQLAQARTGADLGRGDSLDKRRSDAEFDDEMNKEDYQLFAGGYAIKGVNLVDTLDASKNTTFKGTAIGRVYTSIHGDNDKNHFAEYGIDDTGDYNDGHDIAKLYRTDKATLTIDANGKETLKMPFNTQSANADKYYDVTLVKNGSVIEDVKFEAANEAAIDKQYRTYDALDHMVVEESSFNPRYYGVNVASEAAGTAHLYSEKNLGDGARREYEVQAAYGMKRK